jgi:hypothetical protein
MTDIELLKNLIKEILNEENVKLRTSKGYGASHPVVNRKPFMLGLGKSNYSYEAEDDEQENDQKPETQVKISKAFDKEELQEYTNILKELINAEKLC